MRVLYLTMNPNRASTTVPTEGWFRFLQPRGLEPILVSHEIGEFHRWALQQGIPTCHIPLPFQNKWNPFPFVRSLYRLREIVKRYGVQLIHCNEQNIYPIGQYLARLCHLPVIVSIHFTMRRPFCQWAFGEQRQPDRIVFTSRGNLDACRPAVEGVIAKNRWRLLHNGLDLQYYRPDQERRRQFRVEHSLGDRLLIGVACALRERKQLEHLFEATKALSPDVRVVVAGGSIPDERGYGERVILEGQRLLGDRLVHVGHLTELRGFYNALDLFVNTSREEACSLSVLEAMACGCPVIGYPSKSVDGQVLPGGGEIVEQDRIDLLAAALNRWLSNPEMISAGRSGARRRVEEEFDISKLADQLWSEYQSLIN